jgi:hypothetical protein
MQPPKNPEKTASTGCFRRRPRLTIREIPTSSVRISWMRVAADATACVEAARKGLKKRGKIALITTPSIKHAK